MQGKHSTHWALPPASMFGIFTLFWSLLTSLSIVWSLEIGFFVPLLPGWPHITVVCRHVIVSLPWVWDPSSWSVVWLRPPSSHLRPAPPQSCSAPPLGNHSHSTLAELQVGKLGSSTLFVSATLSLLGPKLRIFIELGQEEEKCFLKQTAFGFGIFNELFPSWFL